MRLFFILLPIGLSSLSILTMIGYPLTEAKQRELRAEIERRRAEAGEGELSPVQPAPPAPETDSIMLAKSPAE
jgi:Na+/melibiose symporter-like transporter